MEDTSHLKATSHYIYSPNRETVLRSNLKGLNQYYSISASDEDDSLIIRKHSRHGKGKLISKKEIDESMRICYNGEVDEEKLEDGEYPPAPCYNLYRATQRYDINALKESGVTCQEKKENDLKDRVSKCNRDLQYHNAELLAQKTMAGLFPCSACDDQFQLCRSVFMSKEHLEKHERSNKHKFPKINTITKAFMQAVNENGVLSSAKFSRNRSTAAPRGDLGLELVLESNIEERDWFQDGCYNKPKKKPATRMSEALKSDLLEMFEEGLRTNSKYSPKAALDVLTKMVNPDGRCKYSHHPENLNEPLPDEGRIKSFFSSENTRRKKPSTEKDFGYASMKIDELMEELAKRDLPNKANTLFFLRTILCLHDHITCFEKEPEDDEGYESWKVKSLKTEIVRRELDISTTKNQLITMLILSDVLIEDADAS